MIWQFDVGCRRSRRGNDGPEVALGDNYGPRRSDGNAYGDGRVRVIRADCRPLRLTVH